MSLAEYGYTLTTKDSNAEWDATDYKIIASGSGGGTFAPGNSQATIVYLVEYYYVERFLDVVLGKTVNPGTGLLRRSASAPEFDSLQGSTPEEHPYFYNFFAASAEVVPMGKPSEDVDGSPLWAKALVTVVFRPNNYLIVPDGEYTSTTEINRFVVKTQEGNADFQTSQGQFRFVTDPEHRPLEIQPAIVIANQRLTYIWKQVPVKVDVDGRPDLGKIPNLGTVLPLEGTINETVFDGYEPGTVLFSAYTPTLVMPQAATANNYYWEIAYALSVRDYGVSFTPVVPGEHVGWNYAYDPTRNQWDLYTDTGLVDGRPMYKYGELNDLFAVTW
ncbi:hypothetical protein GobsT_18610 [Gemmata obscuriglobus]|uniref:Uncharacterized protein n=1 Tax=Gemmata obscuriglobus TaxID=114 RepID=A0A2Z3H8C6_9BACT|nr:hypothetical protein [Gemmata obscuriglobus]AWM39777.1 hypothetical protein C1280_24080 [Gemmata obscuriglobus]QEG27108.1 hypothetical protein GobsT_18610 [Gemmata obscuriglobus]VTS03619.1 unnamed protein product [Gemmata obscuriglobus UQM 2246]